MSQVSIFLSAVESKEVVYAVSQVLCSLQYEVRFAQNADLKQAISDTLYNVQLVLVDATQGPTITLTQAHYLHDKLVELNVRVSPVLLDILTKLKDKAHE